MHTCSNVDVDEILSNDNSGPRLPGLAVFAGAFHSFHSLPKQKWHLGAPLSQETFKPQQLHRVIEDVVKISATYSHTILVGLNGCSILSMYLVTCLKTRGCRVT